MKKQILTLLVATATAFTACKDNDNPEVKTKVLSKIISTEDGESTTYNFNYDASKRLTSFAASDNSESTTFTYNTTGSLTKFENVEGDSKQVFEVVYTNSIPATGSFKSYEDDELQNTINLEYTVAGGKVTEIIQKVQNVQTAKSTITYQTANVTKIETVATGGSTFKHEYTYGTKKSMFANSGLKYVIDPMGITSRFYSKNEVLTESLDFAGTELDEESTTIYTYDTNGYPLTATVTIGDEVTTIKFEYKDI